MKLSLPKVALTPTLDLFGGRQVLRDVDVLISLNMFRYFNPSSSIANITPHTHQSGECMS
jgi:hypothetical protein